MIIIIVIIIIIIIIIVIIIIIIIIINFFMMCRSMNTPGLRDPVVMRVLSDFYWKLVHKLSRFCLRHQNMYRLACHFWGSVSGVCLTKVACFYV